MRFTAGEESTMTDITDPKYQEMLDFIAEFGDTHGYGPSIREMQHALGISSTSVVNYRMHILRREGRLEWEDGLSRTVRVVDHSADRIVIRLADDDATMFRDAVGLGDPKTLIMEAIRRGLRTEVQAVR
jgi:SOS-response transcriptional repressor LexA